VGVVCIGKCGEARLGRRQGAERRRKASYWATCESARSVRKGRGRVREGGAMKEKKSVEKGGRGGRRGMSGRRS